MYKYKKPQQTTLRVNKSYVGESIEQKVHRILNNKEPIKDGAPRIYTERRDGVRPEYDIRTDRFEHAIEAMDKVARSKVAKREQRLGDIAKQNMDKEKGNETGGQSLQGTDNQK